MGHFNPVMLLLYLRRNDLYTEKTVSTSVTPVSYSQLELIENRKNWMTHGEFCQIYNTTNIQYNMDNYSFYVFFHFINTYWAIQLVFPFSHALRK